MEEVQLYLCKQPALLQAEYQRKMPSTDNIREAIHRHPTVFELVTFPGEPEHYRLQKDFLDRLFYYPPTGVHELDFWDTARGVSNTRSGNISELNRTGQPMTFDDLVDEVQKHWWLFPLVMDLDDCPLVPTAVHIENYLALNIDGVFCQTHENPTKWTLTRLRSAWMWCE